MDHIDFYFVMIQFQNIFFFFVLQNKALHTSLKKDNDDKSFFWGMNNTLLLCHENSLKDYF